MKKILVCVIMSMLIGCAGTSERADLKKNKIEAAQLNTKLALDYVKSGNFQLANQKLQLAMKEVPRLASTQSVMGLLLERSGDPTGAKRHYLRAISLAPKEGAYMNNYASFLCREGDYKEAFKYYDKAIAQQGYSNQVNAYQDAGACKSREGDLDSAIKYFELALMKSPTSTEILLQLSQLSYQAQSYEQANEYLKRYLATNQSSQYSATLGMNIAKKLQSEDMRKHYAGLVADHFVEAA